ncbi:MAG TPA: prolyl oligopeptidase family serine peptidase [Flavitalea sp.]|nr:prolyl oligopeptidase family serine peptidase [Flavitalea sp.]
MQKRTNLYLILILLSLKSNSQNNTLYSQKEEIYGRKDGMALTMVVTTPKKLNINRAIIYVISGGYTSKYDWINDTTFKDIPNFTTMSLEYLKRGYTVFFVLPASTPGYSANESVADIQKAVQHIRFYSKKYQIDPGHIGITGASSGGNLSLLMGTIEAKSDKTSTQPILKVSSKVQAVAVFYPVTDMVNYRVENHPFIKDSFIVMGFKSMKLESALDFKELNDSTNKYERITGDERISAILKRMSPIYFVDSTCAPTMIYHGDNDPVVPIQQSITFVEALRSYKVPAKLLVKKGEGHGWNDMINDIKVFADWFDEYLR